MYHKPYGVKYFLNSILNVVKAFALTSVEFQQAYYWASYNKIGSIFCSALVQNRIPLNFGYSDSIFIAG